MARILTCGEILVEIMAERKGQSFKEPALWKGPYPSGAPAIFISAAARMGGSAAIVAKVGADDFGQLNIDRLDADRVDTRWIIRAAGETTGVAFVRYKEDGERDFIFHFARAACGSLSAEEIRREAFADCRYFHIMGCSLTAGEGLRRAVMRGCELARERGALISFDPNIRPELITDPEQLSLLRELLHEADILLSGKKEVAFLLGREADEAFFAGKRCVVLKQGARGIDVLQDGVFRHLDPHPVEEVDPTGAGDCFDGCFIACLDAGMDDYTAARYANVAGALSVRKLGPMEGVPFKAELEAVIAQGG